MVDLGTGSRLQEIFLVNTFGIWGLEGISVSNNVLQFPILRQQYSEIYPEKTIIQKESCTTVFTAALFTIARTWKQPKCPSTDEWIKKMWHIYTMEYYSAIKRNEIGFFVVRWMNLESVIQSEVSQKEKNKYRTLTHIYGIFKKTKKQNRF